MNTLFALTKRNVKLFFKDKMLFFTSLITPVILLVLYVTFLAGVFEDVFRASLPEGTSDKLINAAVGGQLFSSLLAVCCVTVAFCSNMLMIADKTNGARGDIAISPVRRSTVALSYFISSAFSTLIICFAATAVCLVYIACIGWYMSFADIMLILLDVIVLTLFGTGLSSLINYFLSSQGQMSAVGTIISAGYGFICGAYMPISQYGSVLGHVLSFLPGTYGTSLFRNHALAGVLSEMENLGYPSEAIASLRDSLDCNVYFFGNSVPVGAMYAILCGFIALVVGAYILLNVFGGKKRKNKLKQKAQ